MRSRAPLAMAALVLAFGFARPAAAQLPVGHTDIGPVLGLGGIGDANFALGGRFEHVFKALPELADGTLGIEVSADWYHWDCGAAGYSCSVSWIPIGVTANYHVKLETDKFDPFIGAGLGYEVVNCSYEGIGDRCGWNSGIYIIGRAGARYFISPSLALYGDVGAGAATLNVGALFKIQ